VLFLDQYIYNWSSSSHYVPSFLVVVVLWFLVTPCMNDLRRHTAESFWYWPDPNAHAVAIKIFSAVLVNMVCLVNQIKH